MATKYLDSSGLSYFWDKLKAFFQEKLVSGTNIKTINSNSVLGSGDISISPDVVYCTCGTAAATAAKVATIVTGSLASLTTGCQAIVKFTNANGVASPTLKVGSTDAKAIRRYGTTAPSTSAASSWNAGSCVLFVYDGSYWYIANYLNSTYSEISVANITNGKGSTTGLVTGRRAKSAVEAFAPVKDVTVGGTSVMNGTTAEVPSIPSVSVSQITSSGTNIADITIDGTTTHLYAPTSGGGFVTDVKVDGTSVVSSGVASIDLTGKSDVGHTHTTSAITDFPSLATVATSGSYNDLSNKPTIPTITDTYSGTSSNGMSGKAVKSAIDALDGTISGSAGAGKTLTAFSQTDGKVSATFGNISITKSQVSDFPTIPTITDTYSGTSQDGMSGIAVKSAIDALDGTVSGTAGAGKTLTAFSQTDGKVSATFGSISITKSQVSDFPSLATVATSGDYGDLLNKPTFSGSTATKTPTEVKTAIDSGNFINITHLDPVYGLIQANNFNYSAGASSIVANVVFYYSLVGLLCFELIGNLNDDTWTNNVYVLAQTSDIPTVSKTPFTPTSGTSYANYGGCYYETYGNLVHVHVGVYQLTANTATIIYTLPSEVRPPTVIFAHGTGGSWNNIGYVEVRANGEIYVRAQGTGCGADAFYLLQ